MRRKQTKITSFIRKESNTKRFNQENNSDDCVIVTSTESMAKSRPFEFDISDTEEINEDNEKNESKVEEISQENFMDAVNDKEDNLVKENSQEIKTSKEGMDSFMEDSKSYTFHSPQFGDVDEFTFHSGYRGYTLSDD